MPIKRSYLDVKTDSKIRVENNTPITDFSETSVTGNLLDLISLSFSRMNDDIQDIENIFDPTLTTGRKLNNIGFITGFERSSATLASDLTETNFRFYIDPKISMSIGLLISKLYPTSTHYSYRKTLYDNGYIDNIDIPTSLLIPANTIISNNEGNINFSTTKNVYLTNSNQEVFSPIISNVYGTTGNIESNTLIKHSLGTESLLKDISKYILCSNRYPITNGSRGDTDDEYRYKLSLSSKAIKNNEVNVRLNLLSIPGIRDIIISRNKYGNGTTSIIIEGLSPIISDGLLEVVQNKVDSIVGNEKIYVERPKYIGIELDVEIIFDIGADINFIREEVRNKIIQYINDIPIGKIIVWNEIIELIMSTNGVSDFIVNYYKLGDYDIVNKLNKNQIVLRNINQSSNSDEKFYTDSGLISVCLRS